MVTEMRKSLVTAFATSLLLALTGCSSSGNEEKTNPAAETCRTLLGKTGEKWAKGSTEQETGVREDVADLASAKGKFYEYAKKWRPADKGTVPDAWDSEVCHVSIREQKPHKSYLSLRFGASLSPFDAPFGQEKKTDRSETLIPVNSDVKLVTMPSLSSTVYYVYVKCKVPGTASGQEIGMPLEGSMKDTLTGSGNAEHLKRLLYSAGVVAKKFDCQNHPVIPATPPTM
jgi:hypothetical protein